MADKRRPPAHAVGSADVSYHCEANLRGSIVCPLRRAPQAGGEKEAADKKAKAKVRPAGFRSGLIAHLFRCPPDLGSKFLAFLALGISGEFFIID